MASLDIELLEHDSLEDIEIMEHSSLASALEDHFIKRSDEWGYIFVNEKGEEEEKLTFNDLNKRTERIISFLMKEFKLKKGERVLLVFPPGLDFVVAFWACIRAGFIAIPVHPPNPFVARDIQLFNLITSDSGATISLTNAYYNKNFKLAQLQNLFKKNEVSFSSNLKWISINDISKKYQIPFQSPNLSHNDIAFLQYTSGSTSLPKGVMVAHQNILHQSQEIGRLSGHNPTSVSWVPHFHDMGLIGVIIAQIICGGRVLLMSPISFLHNPSLWFELISKYKANTTSAPNFAYFLVRRKTPPEVLKKLVLSSLVFTINGAEPVRPIVIAEFIKRFEKCGYKPKVMAPSYGMAENTLMICSSVGNVPTFLCLDQEELSLGKVKIFQCTQSLENVIKPVQENQIWMTSNGSVIPGVEVKIVDPETFEEVSQDRIGEIWVTGLSKAFGYWNNPEKTKEIFEARIKGDSSEKTYLRSGDLGFFYPNPETKKLDLYICGRIKDVIIIRGSNIYPQDIEFSVDQSHDLVKPGCSACFGIQTKETESLILISEVRKEKLSQQEFAQIANSIYEKILQENHHAIDIIVLIKPKSTLKTTSGKIQRNAAKEAFLKNSVRGEIYRQTFTSSNSTPSIYIKDDLSNSYYTLKRDKAISNENINKEESIDIRLSKKIEGNEDFKSLDEKERKIELTKLVSEAILSISKSSKIEMNKPLMEFGFDSLMTSELGNKITRSSGISLSPIFLLSNPAIEEIVNKLEEEFNGISKIPQIKEEQLYIPSLFKKLICSFFQLLFYLFIFIIIIGCLIPPLRFMEYQAGTWDWNYLWFTDSSSNKYITACIFFPIALIIFCFELILVILIGKWILIGKYKEGKYKLYGYYYFRWWMVAILFQVFKPALQVFKDTIVLKLFYLLCGMKFGKNVKISTYLLETWDLIEIGDDCELEGSSRILAFYFENGYLILRKIRIESNCCLGKSSVCDIEKLPKGSFIPPNCSTPFYRHFDDTNNISLKFEKYDSIPINDPPIFSFFKHILWILIVFLYGASSIPFIVFIKLYFQKDNPDWGRYTYLIFWLIGFFFQKICLTLLVILLKWILIGRLTPHKKYSRFGFFGLRKYFIESLIEIINERVMFYFLGTYIIHFWYKSLGMRIGNNILFGRMNIFNIEQIEMVTLEDEVFLGGGPNFSCSKSDKKNIIFYPTVIRERSWFGAWVFTEPNITIGENSTISDYSRITEELPPNSFVVGKPKATIQPRKDQEEIHYLKANFFTKLIHFIIQLIYISVFAFTIACCVIPGYEILKYLSSQYHSFFDNHYAILLLVIIWLIFIYISLFIWCFIMIWLIYFGRRPSEGTFSLSSLSLYQFVANFMISKIFAELSYCLSGTILMNWAFRFMGMKIGKNTFLYKADSTEYGLVEIGNNCTINEATFEPHSFKNGKLRREKITVGDFCAFYPCSCLRLGTHSQSHSTLLSSSEPMVGSVLESYSYYLGVPASLVAKKQTKKEDNV